MAISRRSDQWFESKNNTFLSFLSFLHNNLINLLLVVVFLTLRRAIHKTKRLLERFEKNVFWNSFHFSKVIRMQKIISNFCDFFVLKSNVNNIIISFCFVYLILNDKWIVSWMWLLEVLIKSLGASEFCMFMG